MLELYKKKAEKVEKLLISRRQAIKKGLDSYYLDPCKHGHTSGRYVSSAKCIECITVTKKFNDEKSREVFTSYNLREVVICGITFTVLAKEYDKHRFTKISRHLVMRARTDFASIVNRIFSQRNMYNKSPFNYSANDLKKHIEKRFKKGMNWENHGLWEFDHIEPLYKFTLTHGKITPKEFSFLVNKIENIQPLWAEENRKKSCKF